MKSKAPGFFEEAVSKLQEANEELCRPEEDVVSYMVCKSSQYAIDKYLRGYLLYNRIEPAEGDTLNSLYNRCVELDEKFEKINIDGFSCKGFKPDSRSCSDTVRVSKCFETAEKVDNFLRKEGVLV